MGYRILHRKWKVPKALYALMVPELLGVVALLVLFGLQQSGVIRNQLWQVGNDLGFNSSPNIILYAYANHRPLPTIPMVWSSFITDFNVAISVLSLFILLTKLIMSIMHIWYPILSTVVNFALVILYIVSVYGQAGPDYADPKHPSSVAWYIRENCNVAQNDVNGGVSSCQIAKGSFAATIYMLFLYLVGLGLSIWAMLPNEADKTQVHEPDDEEASPASSVGKHDKSWEMHGMRSPATPGTAAFPPYTPRTMAFNTLERKLPLRSQYS